jgi:hypothetical protein
MKHAFTCTTLDGITTLTDKSIARPSPYARKHNCGHTFLVPVGFKTVSTVLVVQYCSCLIHGMGISGAIKLLRQITHKNQFNPYLHALTENAVSINLLQMELTVRHQHKHMHSHVTKRQLHAHFFICHRRRHRTQQKMYVTWPSFNIKEEH